MLFLLLIPLYIGLVLAEYALPTISEPSLIRQAKGPPPLREPDEDPDVYHFVTRPDIEAPIWSIKTIDENALAPGYWFVAPYADLKQIRYPLWNGPHIYRSNGVLVWSGAPLFKNRNTFDFRAIHYEGKQALSLIDPTDEHKGGVILDDSYRIQHTIDLRGDLEDTNMHDFTIVDNGKHALTLKRMLWRSTIEESQVVGFTGKCKAHWEGFKQLDVETSEVVFDWDPHGRIGLNESTKVVGSFQKMCEEGWDILHLNSIDKFPDGDYLLSSRHTDTIYKISKADGSIVWRLGGKFSDFKLDRKTHFSRQHHARVRSQNDTHILISVFDNAKGQGDNEHKTNEMSRGLLLSLRTDTMTAEMIEHYNHPEGLITPSRGSMQYLPNGNALVCYTYGSLLAEYSHVGKVLMKAFVREHGAHTYRAYKFPWIGRPTQPPDVVATLQGTEKKSETIVHVSWNGATEVNTWKLYETSWRGARKQLVGFVPNGGFETVMRSGGNSKYVVVEAYDVHGHFLGRSKVTETYLEPGSKLVLHEKEALLHSTIQNPVFYFTIGIVVGICIVFFWRFAVSRRCGIANQRKKNWSYKRLVEGEQGAEDEELELLEQKNSTIDGRRSPRLDGERHAGEHKGIPYDVG